MSLKDDRNLQNAEEKVREVWPPGASLVGTTTSTAEVSRQLNTVIALLVDLHTKVDNLSGRITVLEQAAKGKAIEAIPTDQNVKEAIEALTQQVQRISLSEGKPLIPEKPGPILIRRSYEENLRLAEKNLKYVRIKEARPFDK